MNTSLPLKPLLWVSLSFVACVPAARKLTLSDQAYKNRFEKHERYLASDSLEGRRTGTRGEALAKNYIVEQFRQIGLQPKAGNSYEQPFEVNEGKKANPDSYLLINGDTLRADTDYFFFPWSAEKAIKAEPTFGLREVDMPWMVDLAEGINDNAQNPHFDLQTYIYEQSKKAADAGATALLLYNTAASADKLMFNPKDKSDAVKIPVIYLRPSPAKKYFTAVDGSVRIQGRIAFADNIRRGYNVLGYIDNQSDKTVILGAHFDHLGYGEDNNSRHTGAPAIHNGADDNASGTALLIELARALKQKEGQKNNYLFIAFSGEELGLYGSKFFTEHPTVDLKQVNYMINMDMVGRLPDSSKTITLGGYGTSPSWSTVIDPRSNKGLGIRIDSSGTGPSDHASFYRKDIPVLFYFTGLHADYHKPSDDADKINYSGMVSILHHIERTISGLNNQPKLAFLKTREAPTTTTARFSVTMGIMPDYTYSGKGVRADGISEGKPAQKAGLKAGDILLRVGEYTISSMESYMQTLGKFKKGETVKVVYLRGDKTQEADVTF